ncbi:hypothetical protein F444_12673 [Phytophthora nicotianae P1976]|uniref:Uncharacterized protein n=1 Tax=Phytophthora nicotianae P1976 TaxID=1317066 RepID=A0A080ZWB7_PHYNI|nr:hypothetical protein F444_12673 [Phytophthora nicotianae P1976]
MEEEEEPCTQLSLDTINITWLFIKDAITIACSAYQSAVMYRPDYAVNGFKAP